MTKALLMLTGGRSLPDLLTLKYLRPDLAFNVTTLRGRANALYFKEFSRTHFGLEMEVIPDIDPFNEQAIKDTCRSVIQRLPNAEWIMHITTSPKVMGIYAHDIAREQSIPCWFLDTEGRQVVSLVREPKNESKVEPERFFKATVEEYMNAYGRTYKIPKSPDYRKRAESWSNVAQVLAQNPAASQLLLQAIRRRAGNSLLITINVRAKQLIHSLSALGALTIMGKNASTFNCSIANGDILEFLKGDWLEVYVWTAATRAEFADDCQWGYKIRTEQPANELDLVLTYNARLLIAECKTSEYPFKTDHLYKLHSVADLVGGNYVRQVYITNCPRPQPPPEQFDNFCQQAKLRRTLVSTGDQLKDVSTLLRKDIEAPSRSF